MRVIRAICALLVALGATVPSLSAADFVRDEIRINMRSGPGLEYRIVQLLRSGDEAKRLAERGDWIQVRLRDGKEGWVPSGYLTPKPPASVEVPELRSRLQDVETRAGRLQEQLGNQAEAMRELETLRVRVRELQAENIRLSGSSRWKELTAGGVIVLVGMVIGALLPKGGRQRSRRLKL
jgi:SH3 domain protein